MVKRFLDSADHRTMQAHMWEVDGLTTNPSLAATVCQGQISYREWAKGAIAIAGAKPISLEVLSDELHLMDMEAREISRWGPSVYVKIPIMNVHGESTAPLIERLALSGIKLNVTALFTREQIETAVEALRPDLPAFVSVFAGRIADTGDDPQPYVSKAVTDTHRTKIEVIWASTREVFNLRQAERVKCPIVTLTADLLQKYRSHWGKDLTQFSRETVQMFSKDAKKAGLSL